MEIVQEALANFVEILPDLPNSLIQRRGKDLVKLLLQKLKDASNQLFAMEDGEAHDKVLVWNNACWAIGDISGRIVEQIRPMLIEIINTFAEILNVETISQLSQKDELL